ncbi:MAG: ABC transporter substrate-binding protein [Bacteroidia bacterium]|nr:ABC transporter substrate-binding protein [Bacteroidia bacterium]MDW8345679.1 ABC transporter substrate-binding protein [Bacteroidia bacterium]
MKFASPWITHSLLFVVLFGVCRSGLLSWAQISQYNQPKDWVIIRHSTDIECLNPIINTTPKNQHINQFVFQSLNGVNPKTLEIVPFLAALPTRSEDGKSHFFEIRNDAVWGDGTPITGEDVEFTLKVIKNPKVKSSRLRYFYRGVLDIKVDKNNNKKFEVKYEQLSYSIAMLKVLPKHIFDPEDLMGKFSIPELNRDTVELSENSKINKFAEQFNSEAFSKKVLFNRACSSGAYYFASCNPSEELVLQRKEVWWGDNYYNEPGELFVANPKKIIYRVVKDLRLTMNMLTIQDLDVVYDLPAKEFVEMTKSNSSYFNYKLCTSNTLEYLFIGLNTKRNNLLSDLEFRKALSLAIDVDYFLNKVAKEYGRRLTCPGIPEKKIGYNEKIPLVEFAPEKASSILSKLGYSQQDDEGFRYKLENNQKKYIELELSIIEGNHDYRKIAHYLSEAFKQVGVKLIISERSVSDQSEKLNKRDFDMYLGKVTEGIGITNPYTSWHTKSSSNYTGFGNSNSDALIENIVKEKDSNRKKALYDALQEIIMSEVPVILLWSPQSKIAVNSRFQNVNTYPVSAYFAGFNPAAFYTPTELVKYK